MTTVETALGSLATAQLGPTLMHEHIVTRSPGVHENWPHLFERNAILAMAQRKLADLHTRGIRTIVDLTTVDLGRDIDLIADVARRSPVQVIVATTSPTTSCPRSVPPASRRTRSTRCSSAIPARSSRRWDSRGGRQGRGSG